MPIPLAAGERSRTYALGGVARGGITRAAYVSPRTFVAIDGVHYATGRGAGVNQVENETLAISESLDATPNTARFTTRGFRPANGADVVVTLGSKNRLHREFAGTVLNAQYGSIGLPANARYPVQVIDYAWQLTWTPVRKRWTNVSATTIALELIAMAPPGFDGAFVAADLDVLDEFTVTDDDLITALVRLAARIGGHVKVDYHKHVHLPTFSAGTNPTTLVEGLSTLKIDTVRVKWDIGQMITRVTVEGGGVKAVAEVAPGETVIPVEDVAWYPDGGQVVSGPQRISYSSRHLGNAGSLAGPGVSPTASPALLFSASAGSLGTGDYKYDYTFVTAAGESTPSPLATINMHAGVANPSSALTFWFASAPPGGPLPAGTVKFGYTFVTAQGESALGPLVTVTYPAPGESAYPTVPTGPAGTTARKYYRSPSGSSTLRLVSTINDNTTTNITDTTPDGGLGAAAPTSNQTGGSAVDLSSIAIGPGLTTARKVYRSVVNGSQLKLLATIANNTATTYTDTAADGALGANAPVSDTSGLTRADGQIAPGSATLQVTGLAFADAAGGWVTDGWQFIRYTGTATLPVTLAIGITRSGSTATAIAGSATGFVTGQTVTVSGATQPEYNGSFVITSMAAGEGGTTFAYTVSGTPATPATGSPVVAIPGGNLLTGIPASGIGSIESPIWYGSTISAVPALAGIPASGVGAIVETIEQGNDVNVLVQVDDLAAQTALAAVIGGGFDGVITEPLQDRRLSATECQERGEALLALRAPEEIALSYETTDVNTTAGRTIGTAFTDPAVATTFTIQSVEKTAFYPAINPRRTVEAVISRFTFEALLKLARAQAS